MMAAHLADPKPGDQVLDLCAAPGGKSLHAADKMRNQGCVEARDLTEYKVDLIRENVQRAGVSCVVPKVKDAEQLDAEWIGKADVVIADLPCTGYGVIGRKPDIDVYKRQLIPGAGRSGFSDTGRSAGSVFRFQLACRHCGLRADGNPGKGDAGGTFHSPRPWAV